MYVDVMQVRNSEILLYREWYGPRYKPEPKVNPFEELPKAYSGKVTDGAAKRLKKAVSLLVQTSPRKRIFNPVTGRHQAFRLNFVTLTTADSLGEIGQEVTKKCLAPFLRWGRNAGAKSYVWKAELQERGAIHYHVATNTFLHWKDIRDTWNKYQRKAGYLAKYAARNGHYHANSTDVHAMRKVKDIERYLTKYMMKQDGEKTINGKIWDCSQNLKSSKYFATEMTPANLEKARKIAIREARSEHCTIIRIPQDSVNYILDPVQQQEYRIHLSSI